jgi:signal transduction histidine kinase
MLPALSSAVLLPGIAVSVLLAVALRLAQAVSHTARLEERASLDRALQSTTDGLDRGRVVLRSVTVRPLRLVGSFAEVTDRRRTRESLLQAETMSTFGRLAARIAHEINNPLAGNQSAFLLIKDTIPSTHLHNKYVGAIEREVQHISQVTRQLYETYRPETEGSPH